MLVKKSIHTVKNVIHRRLKALCLLVSKGFNQNQLSRALSFDAITSSNNNTKTQQVDNFNRDMSEETVFRHNEVVEGKKSISVRSTAKDLNVYNRMFAGNGEKSVSRSTKEETVKEDNKIEKEKGCLLVEKLKQLEMVDGYNQDHVTDIEEALHYYDLITCPVYQDIVDRFFADMYSEFLLSQPSASINSSMRRLHSMISIL